MDAKTNRIIVAIVVLLVMAGVTGYLIYDQIQPKTTLSVQVPVQNTKQQPQPRRQAAPEAMPQLELRHLDGSPLRLADYAGKIILLNIWSANFAQSIEEMRN